MPPAFAGVDRRGGAVLVVGLGRFGSAFVAEVAALGYDVVAMDRDPRLVAAYAGVAGQVVEADATDLATLEELEVGRFDLALVATASDVEASLLATAALVDAGVGQVWAKALNARHATILSRVGAHRTVEPETALGQRLAHQVTGGMLEYLELDASFCLVETPVPSELVGSTLADSDLPGRHQVTVVAAKCPGGAFTPASGELELTAGTLLVVAGTPADTAAFARLP